MKLGLEAYDYIHNNTSDYKLYKKYNKSLSKYLDFLKIQEKIYNQETKILQGLKSEYSTLIFYSYKLFKEQKILTNNKIKFESLNGSNDILNLTKNIKNQINDVLTCKICYKNILKNNDVDEFYDCIDSNIDINYKFVTLSCGHSICDECHVNLINQNNNVYIKCPVCRNNNIINNTNPNYELNEIINNLRTFYDNIRIKVSKLQEAINDEEKKKTYIKSICFNKQIVDLKMKKKSYECPW